MKKLINNIFITILIFSIWYVVLFFDKKVGLSMFLFAVPFTYYTIYILEKNNKVKNSKAKVLLIPIALLSSTYFIFNNSFFYFWNKIIIPGLVIIMIQWLFGEKFIFKILLENVFEIILSPLNHISETLQECFNEIKLKLNFKISEEKPKEIKTIIKGVIITLIMAVIIILLLSSADETFESIFFDFFDCIFNVLDDIQISDAFIKLILIFITFAYLSSFFKYLLNKYEVNDNKIEKKIVKENLTIKMVLFVLNIIYVLYCVIQIKKLIVIEAGTVYSTYAREGFFQLMIVSFINLITILVAKNAKENETENEHLYLNIMSIIMIVFTFIILITAMIRMNYYEAAYGYTYLRLLVYCALITETIMFIPTSLYVLDKKVDLTKSYFIIVLVIYTIMNFANFDNMIAKRNIDRYEEKGKIDSEYLVFNIGTDGVKQLLRVKDDPEIKIYLKEIEQDLKNNETDFRDFNLSEYFAEKLIKENL